MKKIILLLLLLGIALNGYTQHGFPTGHWCNTNEGWATKRCRALKGLKDPETNKVITIPHRGSWGNYGIPEGSMEAIKRAYNQNYMFIEADLVLTKDKVLVMMHDQQTNRVLSLPKTFSTDGGLNDNGSFVRSLNYNSTTNGTVPDEKGYYYPSFPAMKDAYYLDRAGHRTSYKINTFNDLVTWVKNKEAVIALDIKTGSMSDPVIQNEYLEAVKLCLQKAKAEGVLHQLLFKPGSSGQLTVKQIQDYLTPLGLWNEFSKLTNVVLINIIGGSFPKAQDKGYLDEWFMLPSLVGVEQIYKTHTDPLVVPKAEFGNKSILKYTQDKGLRTGVFHPIPSDEYGAPGGRGNNFNPPNVRNKLNDFRGNIEYLFGLPPTGCARPGMLVTDRPDVDMAILEQFNMNSKYTKRNNSF